MERPTVRVGTGILRHPTASPRNVGTGTMGSASQRLGVGARILAMIGGTTKDARVEEDSETKA